MSSNLLSEKYDEVRIEKIKHHLESLIEKNKARYFEIFVDNLKVVDKTNDLNSFDDYKMYLDDNSRILKILLYSSSEISPRNDKFIFSLQKSTEEQQQLGEIEIENKIKLAIESEREKNKIANLEKEVEELNEEIKELKDYSDKLENALTELKQQKEDNSKQIKYGMVASVAIEELIKRNPKLIANIPLIGALSGLSETDSNKIENPLNTENEASFKEKRNENLTSTIESDLMQMFSPEEFSNIMGIIVIFNKHRNHIAPVLNELKRRTDGKETI